MGKEIERKFLIDSMPYGDCIGTFHIQQGYIYAGNDFEVRVRRKLNLDTNEKDYKMAIKSDGDIERDENQCIMTEDRYYILKNQIELPFITKFYKKFKLEDGHILQCSLVDEGKETQFMYVEVEFDTIEEAKEFIPPSYLGKEVTYDSYYKMKNYWIRTRNPKY